MRRGVTVALLSAALAAGCGDPGTSDDRGYTKAPLENPGLIVEGERPDAMREHAAPILPRAVVLEDTTAGGE